MITRKDEAPSTETSEAYDGITALRHGSAKAAEPDASRRTKPQTAPDATTPIILNGRYREIEGRTLSYEQVVALAYPGMMRETGRDFTVTFRRGPQHMPEGTLVMREVMPIVQEEVVNVAVTHRS